MIIRKQVGHLYEFGPFQLDVVERHLTCEGKAIPLPPKVLDTLLVLVENSGRVMEKEELLKTLWPDTYVEESNLTTYVSQLRKALGEKIDGQIYIETVPRRGYRFIAEVKKTTPSELESIIIHEQTDTRIFIEEEILADEEPSPIVISPTSSSVEAEPSNTIAIPKPFIHRKTFIITALACGILAVAGLTAFFWNSRRSIASSSKSAFQRMNVTKLTANGNIPLASISPDGKYVAHVLQEVTNQSLWVRQTSTTSNVQLVPPTALRFLNPTFSPDGTFIYYVAYDGPVGTLYQIPALGGTPRKLIEDVDSPVTFAPDGKRLAFLRHNPPTKESSLVVADAEGANQFVLLTRQAPAIFSPASLGYYAPSWSPDGKSIACSVLNETEGAVSYQIIAVNVEEKTIRPVTEQSWHWVGQVAWLPDGKGLVANAWDQGTSTVSDQIWHIAYPSGTATRVTNDVNSYKGISVAAKTGAIVTVQAAQVSRLWVMPKQNENEAIPITSGFGENYSEFLGVDWTPDGRIVYGSNASGNADIWLMDRDGKNQKQLTTSSDKDMSPVVSPDGKHIVYVSFLGRVPHIMRMDLDGNNPRPLTTGPGEVAPSIAPDGQWVAYTAYDGANQRIFRVPIDGGDPQQFSEANYVRAEYSPDGKWLACLVIAPESKARKVALLPATGGAPAKIIDITSLQKWSYLHWLADSSALTLAGVENGISNIYQLSLEDSSLTPLTNFKSDWIFRYAWSKNGQMLAVERGMPISDVILIADLQP